MGRIAQARQVFLATLNNESRELNLHRIEKFGLRNYFSVFFSSCYLGVSKPHPQIYQLALDLSQQPPQECVFIDDRSLNLECARRLGLHTIQFLNAEQMESDLRSLGWSSKAEELLRRRRAGSEFLGGLLHQFQVQFPAAHHRERLDLVKVLAARYP